MPHLAGPRALGILVPHGEQTMVIGVPGPYLGFAPGPLERRQRHVLGLLVGSCAKKRRRRPDACTAFWNAWLAASATPSKLSATFKAHAFRSGCDPTSFSGSFVADAPGQAYQPAVFATQDDVGRAAEELIAFLWSDGDANQELYFKTQRVEGGGWMFRASRRNHLLGHGLLPPVAMKNLPS